MYYIDLIRFTFYFHIFTMKPQMIRMSPLPVWQQAGSRQIQK